MSGDNPPEVLIDGAVQGLKEYKTPLILVGVRKIIEHRLQYHKYNGDLIEVEDASEIIHMSEEPVEAFRRKKNASVAVAAKLIRDGRADAMISPGNTGATVTSAMMLNGRLKGVSRPAIGALFPSLIGKPTLILDLGANIQTKTINYLQTAVIGEVAMKKIYELEKPKIALLNVGEESNKGTDQIKKVYKELQKLDLDFVGNAEPKMIMAGHYDVIIVDGFIGNVFLKTTEAIASTLMKLMAAEIKKKLVYKLGALLMRPVIREVKRKLQPDEYGAAPLFGLNGSFLISHGGAKASDIKNGIRMARELVDDRINDGIVDAIRKYGVSKMHNPFWS